MITQVYTSYFYQIRNFKKNYIPISTAKWDPSWYHQGGGHQYVYKDKRGIYNGIRIESFPYNIDETIACNPNCNKDYKNCSFLKEYSKELDKIDFNRFMTDLEVLLLNIKHIEKQEKDLIPVFIVYETPSNKCSERQCIIDWFNRNGVKCKELDYPIG